jgi:type III secretion system FlhB-like substrate exporter
MSNKTTDQNKLPKSVNWILNDYFTIESLQSVNPDWVNITLRVRLKKELDENKIAVIGNKMGGKGRPQLVFAVVPVSKDIITKAKDDGVVLIDDTKLVMVMKVQSQTNVPSKPSPAVTPAVTPPIAKPVLV